MLHSGPGKLKIFGCNEKLPYLHFDHMNLNFKGHLQKCQIFSEDQIGAKLEIRKSLYSSTPAHLTLVDSDQSKCTDMPFCRIFWTWKISEYPYNLVYLLILPQSITTCQDIQTCSNHLNFLTLRNFQLNFSKWVVKDVVAKETIEIRMHQSK